MASGSKGRKQEEANLRAQAEAANQRAAETAKAAAVPDPMEERRRAQVLALDKWRTGESGPVDVRNMPGAAVPMALYRDAKVSRDSGRIGRGYGTLSDGANPNFSAAMDKEMQLERDLAASGALEGHVNDTLSGVDAEMGNWANVGNNRSRYLAELARAGSSDADERYERYKAAKKPSFLKQLAMGALQQGASAALGAI